jgi:hypothetical protein
MQAADRKVNEVIEWLFSTGPRKQPHADAAAALCHSMMITARCRFNAAHRISRLSRISFHTTTVLSLGLVLIPMLQVCGIPLKYPLPILNLLQLFLAVLVLVYSLVISTARYESRADKLNDAGDRINELRRSLAIALEKGKVAETAVDLEAFNSKYSDVTRDSENHHRSDYAMAILESRADYPLTGIPRLRLHLAASAIVAMPYLIPIALLVLETVCLTDMLGVTTVLTGSLVVKAGHP